MYKSTLICICCILCIVQSINAQGASDDPREFDSIVEQIISDEPASSSNVKREQNTATSNTRNSAADESTPPPYQPVFSPPAYTTSDSGKDTPSTLNSNTPIRRLTPGPTSVRPGNTPTNKSNNGFRQTGALQPTANPGQGRNTFNSNTGFRQASPPVQVQPNSPPRNNGNGFRQSAPPMPIQRNPPARNNDNNYGQPVLSVPVQTIEGPRVITQNFNTPFNTNNVPKQFFRPSGRGMPITPVQTPSLPASSIDDQINQIKQQFAGQYPVLRLSLDQLPPEHRPTINMDSFRTIAPLVKNLPQFPGRRVFETQDDTDDDNDHSLPDFSSVGLGNGRPTFPKIDRDESNVRIFGFSSPSGTIGNTDSFRSILKNFDGDGSNVGSDIRNVFQQHFNSNDDSGEFEQLSTNGGDKVSAVRFRRFKANPRFYGYSNQGNYVSVHNQHY